MHADPLSRARNAAFLGVQESLGLHDWTMEAAKTHSNLAAALGKLERLDEVTFWALVGHRMGPTLAYFGTGEPPRRADDSVGSSVGQGIRDTP